MKIQKLKFKKICKKINWAEVKDEDEDDYLPVASNSDNKPKNSNPPPKVETNFK